VLTLPGREELRVHHMLEGGAWRMCGLRGERAGMALGSMKDCATQFASRQFSELFSCFGQFLHFVVGRVPYAVPPFPALFFSEKGERCSKRAVHPLSHHRVHLIDSVNHSRMKMFGATHCRSWARSGRVLGWNAPPFCSLARPKRFERSFQPTLAVER